MVVYRYSKKQEEIKMKREKRTLVNIGYNEYGEFMEVWEAEEKTIYKTYQNNGWIRTNIHWNDGTYEELYSR